MTKIIISGCNGKMGQVLSKMINQSNNTSISAGIDKSPDEFNNNFPTYDDIFECNNESDVIIDFSHPSCIDDILKYASKKSLGVVIATTGFSDNDIKKIENASKNIPIFLSANMSLGINILLNLVKKTAITLNESFDIEIIEKHHNQKIDSPSGTAYMIADSINEELNNSKEYTFGRKTKTDKRQKNEIGIHAIRGGTITGEHTVLFSGEDELLEIKHTASSKKIFATGSIKAALFLANKTNGLYNMQDLVNQKQNK